LSCIISLVCLHAGLDMAMVLAQVRTNIDFGLYEVIYRIGRLILQYLDMTISMSRNISLNRFLVGVRMLGSRRCCSYISHEEKISQGVSLITPMLPPTPLPLKPRYYCNNRVVNRYHRVLQPVHALSSICPSRSRPRRPSPTHPRC
jgi:hypothetical protein